MTRLTRLCHATAFALLASFGVLAAPAVDVAPASMDALDPGSIELGLTGLTGSEARFTLWVDADGDGLVGPLDVAVWRTLVMDNVAAWAPTVVADLDPAAGAVTIRPHAMTPLNFPAAAGTYLWEVEDPSAGASTTAPFAVTQTAGPQSVAGRVSDGLGQPVAGSLVALVPVSDDCGGPEYSVFTDSSGDYLLQLPDALACAYRTVLTVKPGYLFDFASAPSLVFDGDDHFAGIDLQIEQGVQAVTGHLRYAGGPRAAEGIPGVMLMAEGETLSVAFSGFDGSYSFALNDGDWEVMADSELHLAVQGAVGTEATQDVTVAGGPAIVDDLTAIAANAFVRGTLYDDLLQPQTGARIEAWRDWPCDPDCYYGGAVTDAAGDFTLALVAPDAPASVGYTLGPDRPLDGLVSERVRVTLSAGDDLAGHDIEHLAPTAWVTGRSTDLRGDALGDICVLADVWGASAYASQAKADCDGHYSLPVVSGNWNLRLRVGEFAGPLRRVDTTRVDRQIDVAADDLTNVDFVIGGWLEAPTVNTLEPRSGVAGSQVILTAFNIPADPIVRFDGVPASIVASRPDLGRIVVELPAGLTAGVVPVVLEDGFDGSSSEPSCFEVLDGSFSSVCTIGGTVTRAAGTVPVSGALVAVLDASTEAFRGLAVTDVGGGWSVDLAETTDHAVLVIPPQGQAALWAMELPVACSEVVDRDLVTGETVYGRVTGPDGDGIASVNVDAEGTFSFSSVLTDGEGYYSVQAAPGEIVDLRFTAPRGSRFINDQTLSVVVSGPTTAPDASLQTGSLFAGNVVDPRLRGVSAGIRAHDRLSGWSTGAAETESCGGGFAIALPDGEHGLDIDPSVGDGENVEVDWLTVRGDGHAEFAFRLFDRGPLQYTGPEPRIGHEVVRRVSVGQTVLLDVENLVAPVEVRFPAAGGGTVAGSDTQWDEARGLVLTRVPSAAADGGLFVRAAGIDSPPVSFEMDPAAFDSGSFSIGGTVSASSAPLAGVSIVLLVPDAESTDCEGDWRIHDYAVTGVDGTYLLHHPGGDLQLVYLPPVAAGLAPLATELYGESAGRADFDQTLFAGQVLHLRAVAGAPPQPVPNARVEIEGPAFDMRATDTNGEATFHLPPGGYNVVLDGPWGSRVLATELQAFAPSDAGDVVMTLGRMVGGRVCDADDKVVAGVSVDAWQGETPYDDLFESRTDADGFYQGPVASDTDYALSIEVLRDDLADRAYFGISAPVADWIRYPTDRLPAAGVVRGTLRDGASGAPMAWSYLEALQFDGEAAGSAIGQSQSCDDGTYRVKVPAGLALVHAVPSGPNGSHLDGWYSPSAAGDACALDAEAVAVEVGASQAGIDIELDPLAVITGAVSHYRTPAPGVRVAASGGRLGSCEADGWTDGGGSYWIDVPAGSGYRVESDPPFDFPGSSQCWLGTDGCLGWTPVSAPAGSGASGVDFLFGSVPREVSSTVPLLRVAGDGPGQVTVVFEALPDEEHGEVYNVYAGSIGSYSVADQALCHLDPASLVDNGDGSFSLTFAPSPSTAWIVVSSSNVVGESPLGHSRILVNACGATP